ncbi:flagellar basal body-associated FliL family protein [Jatrophihabitans fulvus]
MTAATETAPAGGKSEPAKKSFLKSKKGIIAIVALLAVGGGGAYTFLAPPAKPEPISGGEVVPLDPTTVNLTGGHYLKVAIAVQLVKGKGTAEEFKTSEAAELVIDQFSDRSVRSVASNEARKKLMVDLEKKIKKAYKDEVFDVYLTQFVTQ